MKVIKKYVSESGKEFATESEAIHDELVSELQESLYNISDGDKMGVLNNTGSNITSIDRIIQHRNQVLNILDELSQKYAEEF